MSEYNYLECRIGKAVGLSDSLIKKTRGQALESEEDFKRVDGRVAYTKEGVAKLIGFLQGPESSERTRGKVVGVDTAVVLAATLVEPVSGEIQPVSSPAPTTKPRRLIAVPWTPPDADLIVTRIFPRNQHVMFGKLSEEWINKNGEAYRRKTGQDPKQHTHRIRVQSTLKFVVGMVVPCCWTQADLWTCTRRMPYRKGRWN